MITSGIFLKRSLNNFKKADGVAGASNVKVVLVDNRDRWDNVEERLKKILEQERKRMAEEAKVF